MPVELPHPLRFTPGELLRSAGEIIRQDGTTIDKAVAGLEDTLLRSKPVPLEIVSPATLENILSPPISLRRRMAREGLRRLQEAIDLYQRHEKELTQPLQLRLNELLILREQATQRLSELMPIKRRR